MAKKEDVDNLLALTEAAVTDMYDKGYDDAMYDVKVDLQDAIKAMARGATYYDHKMFCRDIVVMSNLNTLWEERLTKIEDIIESFDQYKNAASLRAAIKECFK